MTEEINHPSHYNQGKYEVIDVVSDWFKNSPALYTAVIYIARAEHKGQTEKDINKAIWFLKDYLNRIKYPELTSKQAQEKEKEELADKIAAVLHANANLIFDSRYFSEKTAARIISDHL